MAAHTPKPIDTPRALVRAALAHARRTGAREVRFSPDGVAVTGHYGAVETLARGGDKVPVPFEAVGRHLVSGSILADGWSREGSDGCDFENLGVWNKAVEKDGAIRLRARKPGAPCLEAVASFDEGEAAALRALYRTDGVDVIVFCEGEGRARELAQAVYAERRAIGLATTFSMPGKPWRAPDDALDDHAGTEDFDGPAPVGRPWGVAYLDEADVYPRTVAGSDRVRDVLLDGKDDGGPSRVLVAETKRHRFAGPKSASAAAEARARPTAVVQVELVKSAPVARIVLNAPARAIARTPLQVADAPWETFRERRDGRPSAPRTWLPTTAHVAESFAARRAPRGYVSGKSLYFHGPVAFSLYDANPVAAFVGTHDGGEVVLMGRAGGFGGGTAGVISMAQADVRMALGGSRTVIEMDDLGKFLCVGEAGLRDYAGSMRRSKDEASHPRNCRVDVDGLGDWLAGRLALALEQRERAYRTKVSYPTGTQVDAERALVRLAELRDRLADTFGIPLPSVGDLGERKARLEEASARYEARQADLAARRAAKDPEASEAAAPGPRP